MKFLYLLTAPGKSRDEITVSPFSCGKYLLQDITGVDTFAPFALSKVSHNFMTARSTANKTELTKRTKYADLTDRYIFKPIAFEKLLTRMAMEPTFLYGNSFVISQVSFSIYHLFLRPRDGFSAAAIIVRYRLRKRSCHYQGLDVWMNLARLFNGTSAIMGYLMPTFDANNFSRERTIIALIKYSSS